MRRYSSFLADARVGVCHLLDHIPCQDTARVRRHGDGWVLCIADGATGAKYGAAASAIATGFAGDWLARRSVTPRRWKSTLRGALTRANFGIRLTALQRKVPLEDFSTTLLVAIASPSQVFAAQVGDGSLIVEEPSGELTTVLKECRSGAYNVTSFVSEDSFLNAAQFGSYRGNVRGLMAITDGLEPAAFDADGEPWPGFIAPVLNTVRELSLTRARKEIRTLLDSPRLRAITSDDVSIAVATFKEPVSWLPHWSWRPIERR